MDLEKTLKLGNYVNSNLNQKQEPGKNDESNRKHIQENVNENYDKESETIISNLKDTVNPYYNNYEHSLVANSNYNIDKYNDIIKNIFKTDCFIEEDNFEVSPTNNTLFSSIIRNNKVIDQNMINIMLNSSANLNSKQQNKLPSMLKEGNNKGKLFEEVRNTYLAIIVLSFAKINDFSLKIRNEIHQKLITFLSLKEEDSAICESIFYNAFLEFGNFSRGTDNELKEMKHNGNQQVFIEKNIPLICEFYKKCMNDESDNLIKFNQLIEVIKSVLKINIELSFYESDISSSIILRSNSTENNSIMRLLIFKNRNIILFEENQIIEDKCNDQSIQMILHHLIENYGKIRFNEGPIQRLIEELVLQVFHENNYYRQTFIDGFFPKILKRNLEYLIKKWNEITKDNEWICDKIKIIIPLFNKMQITNEIPDKTNTPNNINLKKHLIYLNDNIDTINKGTNDRTGLLNEITVKYQMKKEQYMTKEEKENIYLKNLEVLLQFILDNSNFPKIEKFKILPLINNFYKEYINYKTQNFNTSDQIDISLFTVFIQSICYYLDKEELIHPEIENITNKLYYLLLKRMKISDFMNFKIDNSILKKCLAYLNSNLDKILSEESSFFELLENISNKFQSIIFQKGSVSQKEIMENEKLIEHLNKLINNFEKYKMKVPEISKLIDTFSEMNDKFNKSEVRKNTTKFLEILNQDLNFLEQNFTSFTDDTLLIKKVIANFERILHQIPAKYKGQCVLNKDKRKINRVFESVHKDVNFYFSHGIKGMTESIYKKFNQDTFQPQLVENLRSKVHECENYSKPQIVGDSLQRRQSNNNINNYKFNYDENMGFNKDRSNYFRKGKPKNICGKGIEKSPICNTQLHRPELEEKYGITNIINTKKNKKESKTRKIFNYPEFQGNKQIIPEIIDKQIMQIENSKKFNNTNSNFYKSNLKNERIMKHLMDKYLKIGKCIKCHQDNKSLIILECCHYGNNICFECLTSPKIEKCPFCYTSINDEILKKINSQCLLKGCQNYRNLVTEIIADEKCFNCKNIGNCLIISCCRANIKPICYKCAHYLRPFLFNDMKCPICNYEIKNKQLITRFYQNQDYSEISKFNLLRRIDPFKCIICERNEGPFVDVNCCKELQKTCLKCLSNSLSTEKCLFCKSDLREDLKEYLRTSNYIRESKQSNRCNGNLQENIQSSLTNLD